MARTSKKKAEAAKVDIGAEEPLQIVCGAPNARAGIKVAVALEGAVLPGIKIKKGMAKRAKEKKFFRWLFSLRLFCFILDEGLPHNFDYVVFLFIAVRVLILGFGDGVHHLFP